MSARCSVSSKLNPPPFQHPFQSLFTDEESEKGAMGQSCASCGSANALGALFCAHCGASLKVRTVSGSNPRRRWAMPVAALAILIVFVGLYFWLFVLDDMQNRSVTPIAEQRTSAPAVAEIFFTMTEANIRDKPTASESVILGKLPRGSQVTGFVQSGSPPGDGWMELSDGNGFVAMVNLSKSEPPELVTLLNDQPWVVDMPIDVWATGTSDSPLINRVRAGTMLKLVGLTADNFIEVKLADGSYGYLADGKSILARLGGKPIAIGFNPQTCAFSGEIGAEFAKIGARLRTQWQTLEAKEYADEAAREKAYAKVEGKSSYVRLRRSFDGLSLTALGQHYESQSLYFVDPPAKVIAVFRDNGFNIGPDGIFRATELYAAISGTRGEGAVYGKTELSCGV